MIAVKCSLCGRLVSYRRYADHAKSKNCKAPPKYMNNNSNSIGASVVTDHCPMNVSSSKNDGAFSSVPAPVILVPDSVRTTASTNNVKKKNWRDDGRFKFILRHLETFEAGYYGSGARNKIKSRYSIVSFKYFELSESLWKSQHLRFYHRSDLKEFS